MPWHQARGNSGPGTGHHAPGDGLTDSASPLTSAVTGGAIAHGDAVADGPTGPGSKGKLTVALLAQDLCVGQLLKNPRGDVGGQSKQLAA